MHNYFLRHPLRQPIVHYALSIVHYQLSIVHYALYIDYFLSLAIGIPNCSRYFETVRRAMG